MLSNDGDANVADCPHHLLNSWEWALISLHRCNLLRRRWRERSSVNSYCHLHQLGLHFAKHIQGLESQK